MVEHDLYCWVCCRPNTELKCSCRRTFHVNCATQNVDTMPLPGEVGWRCPVCIKLASSRNTKAELQRIPVIVRRVFKPELVDLLKRKSTKRNSKGNKMNADANDVNLFASGAIVNPIDLQKIKEKAETYASFEEFQADLQWVVHNFEVLFTGNHDKTKWAKYVLTNVNAELDSVRTCIQCHIHANAKETRARWFSMVCDKPHLIVWALMKGSTARYLPAKLMSVNGQLANVRFFGGYHKNQDVPIDKCYAFSRESPTPLQEAQYKSCFAEANLYIANICHKFGAFKFAPPRTPMDPSASNDPSLIDRYVRESIPGIVNFHDEKPNVIPPIEDENRVDPSNLFYNMPDLDEDGPFEPKSEEPTAMECVELAPNEVITVDLTEDDEHDDIVHAHTEPIDVDSDIYIMPNEQNANDSYHEHEGLGVEIDAAIVNNDETNGDIINAIGNSNLIRNANASTLSQGIDSTMQMFPESFDRVCQMNAKLKKDLLESQERHNQDVQSLKMAHEQELARLKKTHAQQLAELAEQMKQQSQQTLTNELNMIKEHRKLMEKKDEEHKRVLTECKMEESRLIEIAKRHKYCMGCGKSKQLDLYLCGFDCQPRK